MLNKLGDPDDIVAVRYEPQRKGSGQGEEKFHVLLKDKTFAVAPKQLIEFDIYEKELLEIMKRGLLGDVKGDYVRLGEGNSEEFPSIKHYKKKKDEEALEVSAIKYSLRESMGETRQHPVWISQCKHPTLGTVSEEEVTERWLHENFQPKFINKVKRKRENIFSIIPPGNVNNNNTNNRFDDGPRITFKQHDKNYCAAYSFANAFYYYTADWGVSKKISERAEQWSIMTDYQEMVRDVQYLCGDCYHCYVVDKNYDPAVEKSKLPTLIIPQSSDGGVGHAISTCGEYMFDSNLNYAKPITQELLNWCVSTDDMPHQWVRITFAMRVMLAPTIVFSRQLPLTNNLGKFGMWTIMYMLDIPNKMESIQLELEKHKGRLMEFFNMKPIKFYLSIKKFKNRNKNQILLYDDQKNDGYILVNSWKIVEGGNTKYVDKESFKAVIRKNLYEITPNQSKKMQFVEKKFESIFPKYGFEKME